LGEVTSLAEPVAAAGRGRLRSIGGQRLPGGPGRDGAIPRLAAGALAVYLSALASLLSGAAPAGYRLTVEVENVRNAQGVVGVLVFNTAQGWPEDFSAALRAEATAAHTGVVEITVPDLPAGDYAVVALHDENTNKQLDRNWLGVPVEQWGMSNNPPYRFTAPLFDSTSAIQKSTLCRPGKSGHRPSGN
jgi:uncharacterized protein (DUF2141 family)